MALAPADNTGRDDLLRVGHTGDRVVLPHPQPTSDAEHAANHQALADAINNVPLASTQLVRWNIADLPGDGTASEVGKVTLTPGHYKTLFVASFLSSDSDFSEASPALTPDPDTLMGVPSTTRDGRAATFNGNAIINVPVTTTYTVSVSCLLLTTSDTAETQGALVIDPATAY